MWKPIKQKPTMTQKNFLTERGAVSVVEKCFELKKTKQVKQTTSSKPQSSANVVRHKSESQDKRLAALPQIENVSRKIGLKLRRVAQSASSTSGVTSRLEKQKEGRVRCGHILQGDGPLTTKSKRLTSRMLLCKTVLILMWTL